jgi:hypothetical protein
MLSLFLMPSSEAKTWNMRNDPNLLVIRHAGAIVTQTLFDYGQNFTTWVRLLIM